MKLKLCLTQKNSKAENEKNKLERMLKSILIKVLGIWLEQGGKLVFLQMYPN